MTAINSLQDFAAALDYLPVAARAAARNPGNDILWAEAVHAQRAVIAYADTRLAEREAAEVQAAVGRIAHHAVIPYAFAITEPYRPVANYQSVVILTERAKAHIRTLIASH